MTDDQKQIVRKIIFFFGNKLVKCELFFMENPQIQAQRNKDVEVPIGMESSDSPSSMINPQRSRFPYCIVWTPIPVLTLVYIYFKKII